MANDRLRIALREAGIEIEDLADACQVDTKTAWRWITDGRPPRPRTRTIAARVLGKEPYELWPDVEPGPDQLNKTTAQKRIITYPGTAAPGVPDWRQLLGQAQLSIDLLGITLSEQLHDPDTINLLAAKAAAGCYIRVLVAHPESVHHTVRAAETAAEPGGELRHRSGLSRDADQSIQALLPHTIEGRLELRQYLAHPYNTILRSDSHMLTTLHLHAGTKGEEPVLNLHQLDGIFERFQTHYDNVWNGAEIPVMRVRPTEHQPGPPGPARA